MSWKTIEDKKMRFVKPMMKGICFALIVLLGMVVLDTQHMFQVIFIWSLILFYK